MNIEEKIIEYIFLAAGIAVGFWVVVPLFKRLRKTVPLLIEPEPENMFVKAIPRTDKIITILGTRKVIIGYDYVIRKVGDE